MNEEKVVEMLDKLYQLQQDLESLKAEQQKQISDLIPDPVKEQMKDIELEYAGKITFAKDALDQLQAAISKNVLDAGHSIKGDKLMAVYNKPRASWDSKGLEGFMVAHPEVKAFRSESKPYIVIRG